MTHFFVKSRLLILVILWLSSSLELMAQSVSLNFSLANFMRERQLLSSDIDYAATVVRSGLASARSAFGEANPAWFILTANPDQGGPIRSAIKIRFHLFGADIESCQAEICQSLVRSTAKLIKFSLDGADFTLNLVGFACQNKPQCTLFIPSWSLSQSLQNGGALNPIPTFLTIIQHKNGLSLLDAETGKIVLDLFPDGVPNGYGRLRELETLGEDTLLLKFEQVWLLVDLPHDLALRIDGTGIARSTASLSALDGESFRMISSRPQGSPTGPIFCDRNRVAWSDRTLSWGSGWKLIGEAVTNPLNFVQASKLPDGTLTFLAIADQQAQIWSLGAAEYEVRKLDARPIPASASRSALRLLGDALLLKVEDGYNLLRNGNAVPTTLSFPSKQIEILGSGDAFVKDVTETACNWRHFSHNQLFPNSFQESGLQIKCEGRIGITATESSVLLTNFEGGRIHIEGLLPHKKP